MAKTRMTNFGPAALSLPYPFRGVLGPGEGCIINGARADVFTALGGAAKVPQTLTLTEAKDTETADTERQGDFGGSSPGIPFPVGRIPYGNSSSTGLSSEAALTYNESTNTLSVDAINKASGTIAIGTAGTDEVDIGRTGKTTKALGVLDVAEGIKQPATDLSGTPGNGTINKPLGKCAIDAAATAVTITNSLVTPNSIVQVTKMDNDATLTDFKVVPGSGSFVITGNALATAAVRFMFSVMNPNA